MQDPASKNVFLVGPMGAGKSTIGRILAKELSLEFLDSDIEIEKRAGADIAWIFDVEGEQGFRDRESQMLDELSARTRVLIATGGGSILRPANRTLLRSRGVAVFLDTSLELQLKRTQRDRKRPLLQNVDREAVLTRLNRERQPLYEEVADFRIYIADGGGHRTVNVIMEKLRDTGYWRG